MLKKILIAIPVILISLAIIAYHTLPGVLLEASLTELRAASGLKVKTVDIEDHTITYLEGGEGETILLLHGYGADKDNCSYIAAHLTDTYHVIALDLPGWADSTYREDANYGIRAQADRIHAFTKALGLGKHHVAGNSMGGWISGVYAHKYPGNILSVGLVDNAGIPEPNPSEMTLALQKGDNPLLVKNVDDFDRVLNFVFVTPPEIPTPIKSYLARNGAARLPKNTKIMHDLLADPVSLVPLLPELDVPVFILWGDKDRLIDVSVVEVMEGLLRKPTSVILENTGHLPMIEKPVESAQQYRAFLEGLWAETGTK